MKNTMAVTGHIIGGPRYANVNKITRLQAMIETALTDETNWIATAGIGQRKRAVSAAKIAVYTRILTFLENDSARRIDAF